MVTTKKEFLEKRLDDLTTHVFLLMGDVSIGYNILVLLSVIEQHAGAIKLFCYLCHTDMHQCISDTWRVVKIPQRLSGFAGVDTYQNMFQFFDKENKDKFFGLAHTLVVEPDVSGHLSTTRRPEVPNGITARLIKEICTVIATHPERLVQTVLVM